jgi:hypothetical protein
MTMLRTLLLAIIATAALGLPADCALAAAATSRATGNWNANATWSTTRTGTISTSNKSPTVTGTGTLFLTELAVGMVITTTGDAVLGTVQSIATNTSLTLTANSSNNNNIAWAARVAPAAGDTVTIGGANVVTLTAAATCAGLTLTGISGTLTHNADMLLTVNGDVAIGSAQNGTKAWNINSGRAQVNGSVALTETGNNRFARIQTTAKAASGDNLTITGDLTFTNAAGVVARTVIDMSGGNGVLNLAGNLSINTAGQLIPGTTSVFNFNGTAAGQNVPIGVSSVVYNHLHINNTNAAGATLSNAISATNVAGNLRVQTGTLNNGGFAIVGGVGDAFEVVNGARFNLSGTSAMATGFTKSFGATSTVNYQGGAQNVSLETYGHLILDGGNTKAMPAGTTTIAGNFTLGAATIYNGTTNNPVVSLAGNFSNSGTFNSGTGTFTFNGTVAQGITGATTFTNLAIANTAATVTANSALTVAGTLTLAGSATLADGGNTVTVNGDIANAGSHTGAGRILLTGGSAAHALSGGGSYTNLELNDANGAVLSANATVNGTLTFTSGNLGTTIANTLTIGAAGSIAGAGTSRHVTGNLAKAFSAATTFTYELGDGINYTPIAVTFAAPVTGSLAAAVTASDHPNTTAAASGIDSAKSINRYWTVKSSTISGTYSAVLTYINGTPVDRDGGTTAASFVVRRGTGCSGSGGGRNCTAWGPLTVSGTPTNTQAAATKISISSGDPEADLAVGEPVDTRFSREKEFIFTRELY